MHSDPIFTAIEFAANAHAGQYRKGTPIPYIVHPLAVSQLLIEHRASQDMIIAAILHDTVEDTDVTVDDVRSTFNDQVATHVAMLSEPEKTQPWEERKQHTIDTLNRAPEDTVVIACADKIDNLRSTHRAYTLVGDAVWNRFARPRDKQEWYYQSLHNIFMKHVQNKRYAGLREIYAQELRAVFGSPA